MTTHTFTSPLGPLGAVFSEIGLTSLSLLRGEGNEGIAERPDEDRFSAVRTYINDYFYCREPGRRDITLDMSEMTLFRRKVYEKLTEVPFGEVVTYGELADRSGYPGAARAVGNAMNANPFLIIVPCHRVVASGTRTAKFGLGGFGAGLDAKRFLLRLEGHEDDIDRL